MALTPEETALQTAINTLKTDVAAISTRLTDISNKFNALINPPAPAPTPTPTPTPKPSPSGEPQPKSDLPGWKFAWSHDFNTDVAKGQLQTVYKDVGVYPTSYHDTSSRGMYDPGIISVSNGCLVKDIHTSSDGKHHVAAIVPKLSAVGKWGDVSGGRFAVRFKTDKLPTYKVAWLLWPQSGNWPHDGEIDYPECSLSGTDTIHGFMHRQNATQGSDQASFRSSVYPNTWHTCVIEWRMGKSLKMFMDGVQIGTTQTDRVPSTPMHWVLQTETSLDKSVPINSSAAGKVYIDWLAYWAPV